MRKNSISSKILSAIGEKSKDLLDLGVTILFDPKTTMQGVSLYRDHRFYSSTVRKGVYNLKRYKYLEERVVRNEKKLYLTSKGRIAIIKNILRDKKQKELKWDRKWRAVIFDIPEASRRDRDFLRRELQWIGFKEMQKSVWVFPYNFEKELDALLKFWKFEFQGDIRFLTIEKMEDSDLKDFFNLN